MEAIKNMSNCGLCNRPTERLQRNHLLPYEFTQDDSDDNIMFVCASCHGKIDQQIRNFLLFGKLKTDWLHRTMRQYRAKNIRRKYLYLSTPFLYTQIRTTLDYNSRTDCISILTTWQRSSDPSRLSGRKREEYYEKMRERKRKERARGLL